ncbi:MAG: hypothetical protein MI754_12250 [Chromatiales bacterium]|nr:hypothetical protein [Chromatiales bacterium]
MNRVASLTFPLTSAWKEGFRQETRDSLDQVAAFVRSAEPRQFNCGELTDLHLVIGFLSETGRTFDIGPTKQALTACDWGNSRFNLANALLFSCRYAGEDVEQRFPGALRTLEASQRDDGAFITEEGRPWFYLTSHALMAVHYCGGNRQVVERGKRYLLEQLPRFRQIGFYDGLIETLIFLRWLDVEIPDYGQYVAYVRNSMNSDGGICFSRRPYCRSHWHAVSLLLELQLMKG